jgi:hypothetical protein
LFRNLVKSKRVANTLFFIFKKNNRVVILKYLLSMDFVTNITIELKKEFPNLKIGTRNYWKGGFEIL